MEEEGEGGNWGNIKLGFEGRILRGLPSSAAIFNLISAISKLLLSLLLKKLFSKPICFSRVNSEVIFEIIKYIYINE